MQKTDEEKDTLTRIHVFLSENDLKDFKRYCNKQYRSISGELRRLVRQTLDNAKKEGN